jgi:hypothetical protein
MSASTLLKFNPVKEYGLILKEKNEMKEWKYNFFFSLLYNKFFNQKFVFNFI